MKEDMMMKFKMWMTFIASVLVMSGCSANNAHHNMDHSNMSHEDMNMTEQMDSGHMSHMNPIALKDSTGENKLAIPTLLEPKNNAGTSFTVTAQQGMTEFFDGTKTETYGYNGSFLGPVIRLHKGDKVKITAKNELSEGTTFHWHGLELPGGADGGPHHMLQPGQSQDVEFTVNQQASTLWFHPHPEGKTAEQVYKGLAGLIYIEDDRAKQLGLPNDYGVNDIPLIFQDRTFDTDKQLNYQAVKNEDGTLGDTLLVNGTVNPKLTVGKGNVRLRLLNGSNARNFTFALNTGEAFQQIATDGGLLNKPVTMKKLVLSPGERAEIIIDFSKYDKSKKIALVNEDGIILLPFEIDGKQVKQTAIAKRLNDFVVTKEEKALPVTKKIELFGMGKMVTINGKQFDMNRIDFTQKQDVTEVWEIYNKPDAMGGMTHPFHLHGTQFKVLSVDGKSPEANEQGWKDTVAIKAGQKVKLAVHFKYKGTYMFHCHVLEHEDNGMMGQVKVE